MVAHQTKANPSLSILICTINDRIVDVPNILLTPRSDVMYIVAFQYTDNMFLSMVPDVLRERSDINLIPHPSTGLSHNRNTALSACRTEFALIADDDVRYTHEQLDMVIRTFREHPDVDIACFQVRDTMGKSHKPYPQKEFDYAQRPKGYFYSSIEIALRSDVQFPHFDTRLGLGSIYLASGEEDVFLYQSHCSGLRIHYFPHQVATYRPAPTTGELFMKNQRVRRSKGAVLYIVYGIVGGFVRIVKTALLLPNMRWQSFCDMMDGYLYILRTE